MFLSVSPAQHLSVRWPSFLRSQLTILKKGGRSGQIDDANVEVTCECEGDEMRWAQKPVYFVWEMPGSHVPYVHVDKLFNDNTVIVSTSSSSLCCRGCPFGIFSGSSSYDNGMRRFHPTLSVVLSLQDINGRIKQRACEGVVRRESVCVRMWTEGGGG